MLLLTLLKYYKVNRLLITILSFHFSFFLLAQGQESLNYQMIVHNSAGEKVASKPVTIRLSILMGNAYDTVVYSEVHRVTTNQRGLASLKIGAGTEKTGNFNTIDWSADKYFLKVETDATGGHDYEDNGTTEMMSTPGSLSQKASKKPLKSLTEDKLFISRKYIGNFIDYRHTGPEDANGPNIIWIKTTMESTFGKISAYGKKCDFTVGEKLYLKRSYYAPGGISGYWVYQVENDSSVYYRATDFQHDRKIAAESWFK
jgi:hypothetical protein